VLKLRTYGIPKTVCWRPSDNEIYIDLWHETAVGQGFPNCVTRTKADKEGKTARKEGINT
jgi:hypothetical protein